MANIAIKSPIKKGDLLDPNNWRGIVLMDIVAKTVSIFINTRLQILLKSRGSIFQFGTMPKLGCQDAVFIIKSFL